MEKSNQHPKAEGSPAGIALVDLLFYRNKRPQGSVPTARHEPQAGPASCLSNSASKDLEASGNAVNSAKTSTDMTDKGEVMKGSPASESVRVLNQFGDLYRHLYRHLNYQALKASFICSGKMPPVAWTE